MRTILLLTIGCAVVPQFAAAQAPPSRITAVHCGHLLDVLAGRLLGQSTVLVDGTRIKAVEPGRQTPSGAAEVDLSALTCLPGLIDDHTHLTDQTSPSAYVDQFHWNLADYVVRSTVYARRTLLAGFTTVRNVGDSDNESVALRNAINAGILVGPRIFTAGIPSAPPAAMPIAPTAIAWTSPATQE